MTSPGGWSLHSTEPIGGSELLTSIADKQELTGERVDANTKAKGCPAKVTRDGNQMQA